MQYDTSDTEGLWQRMSDTEKKIGGRLLAIPHNGNLSGGVDVCFGSLADPSNWIVNVRFTF